MSEAFSNTDIAVIIFLLRMGHDQHRIASLFDVNQGRISEINSGKRPFEEHKIPTITIQFPRSPIGE